jgi:hypothetical protein
MVSFPELDLFYFIHRLAQLSRSPTVRREASVVCTIHTHTRDRSLRSSGPPSPLSYSASNLL